MKHRFIFAVLAGFIIINSAPLAFAQSKIGATSSEQRLIVAQNSAGDAANDRAFWESVKDSKNPDELRAYLEQFPTGVFAALARTRLKALETGGTPSQVGNSTVSTVTGPREIRRDGRFVAYDDGTVLDTSTNLMWAAKDNGKGIYWGDAEIYCDSYRGGGYTDWRMPTEGELKGLYDEAKTYQSECRGLFGGTKNIHLTELIRLGCDCVWAFSSRAERARSTPMYSYFVFSHGIRGGIHISGGFLYRALPVRSGK